MSDIERDYATARDLIRKAEAAGVSEDHALRDAVKRLHGAAITNAGAVVLLREAQRLMTWDESVPVGRRVRWATDVDALDPPPTGGSRP